MSEDEAALAPIDAGRVAWIRRTFGRALGLAAGAAIGLPIAASMVAVVAREDAWLVTIGLILRWELAAAAALAVSTIVVLAAPFASRGTLRRREGALVLERPGQAPRAIGAIEAGYLVPDGTRTRAELHLANGDRIDVDAPDAATAAAVLRLAGVDAAQQRARIRLSEPIARTVVLTLLLGAGGCGSALVPSAIWGREAAPASIALSMLLGCAVAWVLARLAAMPEITVGTDGVSWRRGWRRSFIPLSEIEDVRSVGLSLTFVLRDGRRRTLRSLTGADPASAAALADRVRAALAAQGEGHASGQLSLLDRRGRSIGAWSEALTGLSRAGAGYRAAGLSAEDLAAIVTSPDVSPERRLGAALALRGAGHPAAGERIRVAAAQCASARLRVALETVSEGAIDLAAIEEALAETEMAAAEPAARRR